MLGDCCLSARVVGASDTRSISSGRKPDEACDLGDWWYGLREEAGDLHGEAAFVSSACMIGYDVIGYDRRDSV